MSSETLSGLSPSRAQGAPRKMVKYEVSPQIFSISPLHLIWAFTFSPKRGQILETALEIICIRLTALSEQPTCAFLNVLYHLLMLSPWRVYAAWATPKSVRCTNNKWAVIHRCKMLWIANKIHLYCIIIELSIQRVSGMSILLRSTIWWIDLLSGDWNQHIIAST